MKKYLFTFPVLFLSLTSFVFSEQEPLPANPSRPFIEKAHTLKLSEHLSWHKLLHYQRNIFLRVQSDFDDPNFFLSPHGRKNPRAELDATIRSFFSSSPEGEPSYCSFPARFYWIDEKLGLSSSVNPVPCDRFEKWKQKLAASSVSFGFSSSYLNNPASMYGHTFLKLKRAGYEKSTGLLDYTINYAANTDTKNGILFAWRGLSGGYPGRYATTPYYVKIQKYNNMESRDIWEYDLNLSSTSIQQLVRHLWEVGPTSNSYFFFNKNCAYQLLPILEVADASLDLSREYRYRAIPLDTVQSIYNYPGLVTDTRLRSSHTRMMMKRRSYLSKQEILMAEDFALDRSTGAFPAFEALSSSKKAWILDTAYDYHKSRTGFYRNQPEKVRNIERNILSLRSSLPKQETSQPELIPDATAPHKGHRTGRVGVAVGSTKDEPFQEVSARAAIHDLEGDPEGYVDGSQLEMFHLRMRYDSDRKKGYLEELTFVEILSLSQWDRWVHPPSWHVRTGAEVARDLDEAPEKSLFYGLSGGSGYSLGLPLFKKSLGYVMWKADSGVGGIFRDSYRVGAGGVAGVKFIFNNFMRLHAYASAIRFPVGNPGNQVRYYVAQNINVNRNAEFRLVYERQNAHQEGTLGFNVYY